MYQPYWGLRQPLFGPVPDASALAGLALACTSLSLALGSVPNTPFPASHNTITMIQPLHAKLTKAPSMGLRKP